MPDNNDPLILTMHISVADCPNLKTPSVNLYGNINALTEGNSLCDFNNNIENALKQIQDTCKNNNLITITFYNPITLEDEIIEFNSRDIGAYLQNNSNSRFCKLTNHFINVISPPIDNVDDPEIEDVLMRYYPNSHGQSYDALERGDELSPNFQRYEPRFNDNNSNIDNQRRTRRSHSVPTPSNQSNINNQRERRGNSHPRDSNNSGNQSREIPIQHFGNQPTSVPSTTGNTIYFPYRIINVRPYVPSDILASQEQQFVELQSYSDDADQGPIRTTFPFPTEAEVNAIMGTGNQPSEVNINTQDHPTTDQGTSGNPSSLSNILFKLCCTAVQEVNHDHRFNA